MTQAWHAEPIMPVFYYAGCSDLQCSNVDIVMVNRRATSKLRRVCEVCAAWLLQELLANVVVVSPPDVVLVLASFFELLLVLLRVMIVCSPGTQCGCVSLRV